MMSGFCETCIVKSLTVSIDFRVHCPARIIQGAWHTSHEKDGAVRRDAIQQALKSGASPSGSLVRVGTRPTALSNLIETLARTTDTDRYNLMLMLQHNA